jgi:hypothetical protein
MFSRRLVKHVTTFWTNLISFFRRLRKVSQILSICVRRSFRFARNATMAPESAAAGSTGMDWSGLLACEANGKQAYLSGHCLVPRPHRLHVLQSLLLAGRSPRRGSRRIWDLGALQQTSAALRSSFAVQWSLSPNCLQVISLHLPQNFNVSSTDRCGEGPRCNQVL